MDDEGGEAVLPGPLERPEENFSGQAVDVLREMLLLGHLEPGQRLNEVELAKALGISRGPLREAIQRLRSEGLLSAVSGRGAYVRTFTPEVLSDLYEVRMALEAHALRLAARHLTAQDVEELRELLDGRDEHPDGLRFHERMAALSRNAALLDTLIGVHRQIRLACRRQRGVGGPPEDAPDEHRALVDHLDAGRIEEAAEALTDHLRRSLHTALELLDAGGSGTD